MSEGITHLHWADYVVAVFSLVIALGIGVFFAAFRGGQKTKEEYLVGNRKLGLGSVCLSLFATFQSAISLIGTPADVYNTGTMVIFIFVGVSLSCGVVYFTLVPLVYPLRLISVYQYLEMRFGSSAGGSLRLSALVKAFIVFLGMFQTMLYMAIAMLTPALVLQAVAGLSLWVSLVLVGSVGTIYTAIGGIKSVVWTDVFQSIIMFTGLLAVLIKGLIYVGGFSQMMELASEGGRLIFDEVDIKERHSIWSTVIGACFGWMVCFFNQSSVQRICSMSSMKDAKRCFLLTIPLTLVYGTVLCLTGVLLYAYFVTSGCDPYAAGFVQNKNQVGPYFVLHVLRDTPGMVGLYMATLFCGVLSTFSSGINALAANTVEDVLAGPLRNVAESKITVFAKMMVVVYGVLCLALAYLMSNLKGPVTQMSNTVIGAFGSPVLGVFFLAAGFPRCNIYGAGGGIAVGSTISLTVTIGSTLYGAPTPSLPPAPTDHCDVTNITSWTTVISNVTLLTNGGDAGHQENFNFTSSAASIYQGSHGFTIWDISYQWFSVIGFWATVLSGMVISVLTGFTKDRENVDPKLIFPFCRKLYGLSEVNDTVNYNHGVEVPLKEWQEEKTAHDIEKKESSPFVANGDKLA